MEQEKIMIKKREEFTKAYEDFSKTDISKEIVFIQSLQLEKLEKIRSNTSKLVWWLVAIPVLGFLVYLILTLYL